MIGYAISLLKSRGVWKRLLANIAILILLCVAVAPMIQRTTLARFIKWGSQVQENLVTKPDGTTVALLPEPPDQETPNPEKMKLAQDLAAKLDRNSLLPETSMLRNDDLTSDSSTALMLETLAVELGSSELYALIRTYRENEESANESQKQIATSTELAKVTQDAINKIATSNPSVAASAAMSKAQSTGAAAAARDNIQRVTEENNGLAKRIAASLQRQGYQIDVENVKALCASPDRNDIIGLAKSFRCLQVMTKELELLVLAQPDKNQARKYYATYSVLLLAMDKIQTNYINKIDAVHIPYANTIIAEAEKTIQEAQGALLTSDALANPQATAALGLNIKMCKGTCKGAQHTINQLLKQREKLVQANRKIKFSIIAAKNTHKTLSLQTELAAFMRSCATEMQEVESLSLPDMLVIKFDSDQDLVMKPRQPLN